VITLSESGLHEKYTVLKDGEEQEGCFVLKPESDNAALEALITYADETPDFQLRSELRGWIMAIDQRNNRDSDTGNDQEGTDAE